ncbi:LysR family transcriptional regulator [Qingshengfaniella alkalisoli]|uniref:LysR family transcriptional regulator n=1 Tax=Qingshengfaniella alkalisoli TaxID=2599296 RepID=A0A5B8J0V5_9RHOB|nr:LysR family transcriptional regulator [Qingshengfaniella alkalisoli]QDY71393.1 LysR family transcriptional regulator [Qingshengfaniella alkalisoli]
MDVLGALTLDQLRVLVTIADTGSFSAAGRSLMRAQSAISQSVANLEATQGVMLFDRAGHRPVLTEAGRVLVEQARLVLAGAARFEAVAAGTRQGLEPELTLAIDPMVPSGPLIESLRVLHETWPQLPISFSTEGLGGALRRLRRKEAALAIGLLLPDVPEDVVAVPLSTIELVAVAALSHPLARCHAPLTRADLEPHVQLVLSSGATTDGPDYGVASFARWRFIDLGRRLDFLRAGFGWCRMPRHLVEADLKDGRLVQLDLDDDATGQQGALTIYATHLVGHPPGPVGRRLLAEMSAE